MRKSCDVTDAVKTFRKSIITGWDGALIPIKIHKINPASFGVFTECFDDVCDVTRLPHWQQRVIKAQSANCDLPSARPFLQPSLPLLPSESIPLGLEDLVSRKMSDSAMLSHRSD